MKNILFYGNCQLEKLIDILCLKNTDFNITYIPCFSTCLTDLEFDGILKNSDIIITQPIHDNYRDMYYLASNYVVNKCKENSIIIFFNNCHFDFYYFDLIYSKSNNYFNSYMIDCINENLDYSFYNITYVENVHLKTIEELNSDLCESINNLKTRFEDMLQYKKNNTYFINIVPFIEENYKDKLLFYSFNHPTKYLLQFIALKIIEILGIPNTINYELDPFSNEKCILYACLQKVLNFNIKNHQPLMNNTSSINDIYNATKEEYKK